MIPGYLTFEDIDKYIVKKISQTLTFKDIYFMWINSYDKKGNPPKISTDIEDISELFFANAVTNDDKEKTKNFLSFLCVNYSGYWELNKLSIDVNLLDDVEKIIDGEVSLGHRDEAVCSVLWELIWELSYNNLLKPGNVLIKRLKDKRNIDLIKLYKTLEPYEENDKIFKELVEYIDTLAVDFPLSDGKSIEFYVSETKKLVAKGVDVKTILNAAAACNVKLSDEFVAEIKKIQPVVKKVDEFKKASAKAVARAAVKTKKIDTQKKR